MKSLLPKSFVTSPGCPIKSKEKSKKKIHNFTFPLINQFNQKNQKKKKTTTNNNNKNLLNKKN